MSAGSDNEQLVLRNSKKLPIVVGWGDKRIHLGELEFLKNGALVFESRLHNDASIGTITEFGKSNFKDNKFHNSDADQIVSLGRGFHVTLHPPEGTKPAAMHYREHYPGDVLFRREIDWFPVKTAFNLLRLYTMPLDMCPSSEKQVTIEKGIDPNYKHSLELVVDVFPRDVKSAHPYPECAEAWGHCPQYRVRLSMMLAKQRTPALIYWPEDSELSL